MQKLFDTDLNPRDNFQNQQSNRSYINKQRSKNSRNYEHNQRYWSILNVPKMIGYFSVNECREFMPNASKIKYLKMPRTQDVLFDLNEGIEYFRPKPESVKHEKMDFLLRFILNNVEKFKIKGDYDCHGKLLNPDVICSRGRLTQIMCCNHYGSKRWSLIVSKYQGNIYICQPDGDDFHTLQTKYGYKFEQYLMTGIFDHVMND